MSSDWSKLQDIFDEAWGLDGESRRRVIAERCGDDAELRSEVERMLLAYDEESRATVKELGIPHGGRFGVWQTSDLLGRGGMAEVYLARRVDGHHEQRAALKVMSPYLATAEYIDRFHRERQLLARLEHPNIARLLDGGVSQDGAPYMVMEYVEGERLDEYCESHGLGVRERVQLMRSLCLAVESAHRNLILHRDIKPSNVLVTTDGVVKLLDFGAARELDSESRETRGPVTPAYASPEQLQGEPVTTLSDVYGLGATLYRLLAGAAPFGGSDKISYTLFRSILEEEAPLPSASTAIPAALRRELKGDLDNIVRKAMEKDPARRYASAERLAADLGRWVEKRPIEARPRTWGYRAERFVKRNPWGVALGAALLVTLAGAVAEIGWQVRQEHEAASRNARLTEFLTRVMGLRYDAESSPMRAHGRTTRMVDVIRYASDRLSSEMADQPQLEARLDADIGHAWAELGYFADAERSLDRGLKLVDAREDPVLAGELKGYLARNHFLEGSVRGTEKLFYEALGLIRSRPSVESRSVEQLLLLNLVPVRDLLYGETPESAEMVERAVELGREMGERSPAYALALQGRANLRLTQGRLREAEEDLTRALAIQKSMAVVPFEYVQSQGVLAVVRAQQGKLDEALEMLREVIPKTEEAIGRNSLNFQLMRITEGQMLARQGDLAAAAKEYAEVDEETARILPMAKWIRAKALASLGATLVKMGRGDEGRAAIEKALALAREDPGPESPLARGVAGLLGKRR